MTKIEMWPPPKRWKEVVVRWTWIFEKESRDINKIIENLNSQPGGNYHLHGKGTHFDFAFRFEDPKDALWFRLVLPE